MQVHRVLLFTCTLILSCASFAYGQVHQVWEQSYDAGPSGYDEATDTAVAPSGNVYVVGFTGHAQWLVLKYDPSGTLAWARTFSLGVGHDYAYGVVIDPATEDVYVVGRGDSNSTTHGVVVKYDSAGTLLWSTVIPTTPPDTIELKTARLRANGNLVVGGASGDLGLVAAEFDPLGNMLWSRAALGGSLLFDMTLDPLGNVILVGWYDENTPGTVAHFGVSKFSPTGSFLWTKKVLGGGVDREGAFAVIAGAKDDSIYVAGRTYDPLITALSTLVKFDSSGNVLWTRTQHGTQSSPPYWHEEFTHLAFALNGNIRVCGVAANVGSGTSDIRILEYTPAGAIVWQDTWNGPANLEDSPRAMQTEADNSVTILGYTVNAAAGYEDPVVLRWDGQGSLRWASINSQSGPSYPYIYDASFGPRGVYVFGGEVDNLSTDAYVLEERDDAVTFCSGDGSGTACPCANNGTLGNGCGNSINPNGANLTFSGSPSVSADTIVLDASGMPNASVLYFQGTVQLQAGAGAVFGDGLRCVGGSVIRLGAKTNTSGASQYPSAGDPLVSVRGLVPPSGGTRTYQCWYRNAATFCTASTFNLTNGLLVAWFP